MRARVSVQRRRDVALAIRTRKCICGANKAPMHPFCSGCRNQLPQELSFALTRMLKGGFIISYEKAVSLLGHPDLPSAPVAWIKRAKDAEARIGQLESAKPQGLGSFVGSWWKWIIGGAQ